MNTSITEMMGISPTPCKALRPVRKILFIIDSIWGVGGAELALLRLVRDLPADRFESQVITFHSGEGARKLIDRFPCPVHHWQLNNIYDWTAWKVAARLYKFVQKEQFDIVHTFFETSDLWAGPIAKAAGAKYLVSSRRDMGILRRKYHRTGYRLLSGIFDQIQTVSDGVRHYTIDTDKVDANRTLTIHNGIDASLDASVADANRLRQTLKIDPSIPVITCVANLRRVKGIDVLVRAAGIIGLQAKAQIVVAGNLTHNETGRQEFTQEVMNLNQSLPLEHRVRFIGECHEIPAFLKLSDIFVLPSRSEGLSNALLEAMVFSLPCVATSVGGNPEVVVDGETGFLVAPDSPEELAEKLLVLLRSPDLLRKMGDASRERILHHFTTEMMVSNVVDAYQRILEN